ncbi:hypothetical protein RHOSPDRAFT_16259 [Rhodotorula sp. JG-1b]|nr:hypothetical protein RHOSPDRAFT_16259 [Rhodotorula sp. JG-1b]
MLYAAQAQPPTAQLSAVQCRLFSPTRSALVVNKLDRIECSELQDDDAQSLVLVCTVPVHGAVAAIQPVHLPHHDTASLVVLTTSLRLFVLARAADQPYTLETVSSISIEEPFGRLDDYQSILVDPQTRCLAVHAYAGLLRVIPLVEPATAARSMHVGEPANDDDNEDQAEVAAYPDGPINLDHNFSVRLPSLLNVHCLAFVNSDSGMAPTLACIHTDHTGSRVLTSIRLDLAEKDVLPGPLEPQTLTDQGSEVIIPVVEPRSLLIVGENTITCVRVPTSSAGLPTSPTGRTTASPHGWLTRPLPVARITAWAPMTEDEILLGDIYGKLLLVKLVYRKSSNAEQAITDLHVTDLGDVSSLSLSSFSGSFLFYVASRFGDSQLVRLDRRSNADADVGAEAELQLVASYPSLAPIIDCCLVEDEASGSSRLITCSGAYKTGSLRVVQRGVGLSEMAALVVPNVQRLWSIPEETDNGTTSLLVLGSYAETRVLRISSSRNNAADLDGDGDDLDIEEVSVLPFADPAAASATTIFAGALGDHHHLVQVRSDGVAYSSSRGDETTAVRHWKSSSGRKVTAAESCCTAQDGASSSYLLIAVEGGELEVLRAQGGELVSHGSHKFAYDIASMAVGQIGGRPVVAVGLWTCQEVHLLAVPAFEQFATLSVDSTYLICSLAIDETPSSTSTMTTTTQDGNPSRASTLLVGLGDGSLLAYDVDSQQQQQQQHSYAIRSRSNKPITLGTKPLTLANLDGGASQGVLALSERPTIVTSVRNRLTYSSVNLTDVVAAASLRLQPQKDGTTESPSSSSLLAVATSEGVVLGQLDAVRQIDIKTVPLDEDEPRRIAHDPKRRIFGVVCSRRDVDRLTGSQTVTSSVRFVRQDDYETTATHVLNEGEEAHSIASVAAGESTFFVVRVPLPDRFREGAEKNRKPLPCKQVAVWSISPEGELTSSATWSGAFIAYMLARGPSPRTLIVGDALRSVTLLEYVPPASAPMQAQLKELGKDYRARYMVAVEALSSRGGGLQRIIGAEADLNMFTLERDAQAGARDLADAGVLSAQGRWHVGEVVSRFRPSALGGGPKGVSPTSTTTTTYVQPRLVYTTAAGSIGVIAEVDTESGRILSSLERNLRSVLEPVGGLDQEAFRSYHSDKVVSPSAGFVDGSYVERFLDLSEPEQDRVLAGRSEPERVDVTREEVIALLEEMARTH